MVFRRRLSWKVLIFLIVLGAVVLAGIVAFRAAWAYGCRMATANGLQQIMLAMENYRQKNGCYPPQ